MRRREDRERPPIPDWLLDGRPVDVDVIQSWAAENGYRKLEILRARRDAHRAPMGVDDDAPA